MKEKLVIFIVGLLLGAIISTGAIYFYTVANNSNNTPRMQMNGGPNMSNGEPPEMPNNNFQGNSQTSSN